MSATTQEKWSNNLREANLLKNEFFNTIETAFVVMTECDAESDPINHFYQNIYAVELSMFITPKATAENTKTYLQGLIDKIKNESLKYIVF